MEGKTFCYKYPRPSVTTDCVLFSQVDGRWKVLLIERGFEPYKGCWAFPGGFLEEGETAEVGVLRELKEETGLTGVSVKQLQTFTAPGRDPRGWTISIAFWAVVPMLDAKGADDAARAEWFDVENVPSLAFDHNEILSMALRELGVNAAEKFEVKKTDSVEQNSGKPAMGREAFELAEGNLSDILEQIRKSAHQLHADVNQTYGDGLPYGFHIDMVADAVRRYGHLVCQDERDVLPLLFGAYYHDSIEDARLTYNDVTAVARQFMDEELAKMAAEIVYALTNDKGRNRAERAGENYYRGIRETPYAPFVKLADRLANISYSFSHANKDNVHMKAVYSRELPHFLEAIQSPRAISDCRFALPEEMISAVEKLISEE